VFYQGFYQLELLEAVLEVREDFEDGARAPAVGAQALLLRERRLVRGRVEAAAGRERPSLSGAAEALLDRAVDSLPLSVRGRGKVARVATTIAALGGEPAVTAEHLAEALSYRSPAELAPWS
jgi:predicted ATPase with chaperone activity